MNIWRCVSFPEHDSFMLDDNQAFARCPKCGGSASLVFGREIMGDYLQDKSAGLPPESNQIPILSEIPVLKISPPLVFDSVEEENKALDDALELAQKHRDLDATDKGEIPLSEKTGEVVSAEKWEFLGGLITIIKKILAKFLGL